MHTSGSTSRASSPPRRRLWLLAAPLIVAAATTAGCVGAGPPGPDSASAAALLAAVNAVRTQYGLSTLAPCPTLANAATRHATDMALHGVQPDPHVGSDGSTMQSRDQDAGYWPASWISENVAWGQTTVEQVLTDWLSSKPHADNILDRRIQHAGFARVGNDWVQEFGAGGTC